LPVAHLDLDQAITLARALKEHLVRAQRGPADLRPHIQAFVGEGSVYVDLGGATTPIEWGPPVQSVVAAFRPECVVVVADSFVQDLGGGYHRGDLAQRFDRGDFTVGEAVLVGTADTHRITTSTLRYHYDDRGLVRWDKAADQVAVTARGTVTSEVLEPAQDHLGRANSNPPSPPWALSSAAGILAGAVHRWGLAGFVSDLSGTVGLDTADLDASDDCPCRSGLPFGGCHRPG
jgi:hypothetical protein